MLSRILFIAILLCLVSCCKDEGNGLLKNDQGEIIHLPYLWKIPLHEDNNWQSHSLPIEGNIIIDTDKVLIFTNQNSQSRYLTLISSETGEVIWKWNEWYQPQTEDFLGRYVAIYNNHLHWITGTRHYWVDLETGETVKRYRGSNSFSYQLLQLDNTFFALGQPLDTLETFQTEVVFKGDFYSEVPTRVLVPSFKLENAIGNRIGQVSSIIAFEENLDTFLIVAYQDIFPDWNFQSYLGLYNLTSREWVYEKIQLSEINRKGVLYQPLQKFDNTVIINVGLRLMCYNFYTGEKIWDKEFPHEFSFSGFGISEGIVVASCENKVLYGLDARTGDILWTGEGAGTNSKLENRIMNGVAYFGGGSSGFFHAVDIHTGKTLWKLDPYLYEDGMAFWTWSVNLVPGQNGEKGKVIIQNALNAYCFEAAQ